jgi:hypothetical protein
VELGGGGGEGGSSLLLADLRILGNRVRQECDRTGKKGEQPADRVVLSLAPCAANS